jgi:hypothetical protein
LKQSDFLVSKLKLCKILNSAYPKIASYNTSAINFQKREKYGFENILFAYVCSTQAHHIASALALNAVIAGLVS